MRKLTISEIQFLELLKEGLSFSVDNLKKKSEVVNWKEIFKISTKQTVQGVVYDGITHLDASLRPSKSVLMEWFGRTMQMEKANQTLNIKLVDIVIKYKEAGLHPILLKGQGLGQYYNQPLHRQSGDIDLFFFNQYEKANVVAALWENVKFEPDTSYHRAFFYNEVEVENHRVYVDFYCECNKKAWQKIQLLVPLVGTEKFRIDDFEVDVPSPQMNVIYVFLHIMHHFLQIGVGMRQVCDWACLWNKKHDEIEKELFLQCVDILRIRRSMIALTYIVTRYLGLPTEYIPLDATTAQAKKDGELMLRDILDMGNFGRKAGVTVGFKRNSHLHNIPIYLKAFRRQLRLYRFYPSEVRAYPWVWLKEKIQGK